MKKLIQIMLAIVAIVTMAMFACSCSPSSITSVIKDNTSKLQTPDGIYLDEDNVLRWNSVTNAASYIVTIDEKDYERSTVACDLKKILKSNGTYEVFVKAKSDTINISDSDYSEGVTINFTGAKEDSGDQTTETKLFGEFEDLFTKEAYIGYGYDVIGSSYVNSREVKMNYPIFDRDKLANQRLMKINERDSQDEYISGNSMESYQAEFEAKLKTKLKISKAFSASLNAKYKTTTSSTASALFYEYRHSTVCYSLVLQCDFEEYKNMLTDSFKRDLMNLDLPTLFSRYGTHLITSTIMGGRFDLNYTMLSSENIDTSKLTVDLDTTLKAWCVDTSVSASVDIEEKAKQNKCDISTYSSVYGGDYVAMQNEKAILSNYQKWLSTVEQKPALIGIRDVNSLVPVWELLGDSAEEQTRKSEMQNYFAKYGQETYNALLENYEITPPIYPTGLSVTLKDEKKNSLTNNTTYAGAKIYLDLAVTPENAPISKSVTFSDPDYVIYNSADNSVLLKDNVPNDTTLYITVDIGSGISQTVAVKIMQTYTVSFRSNGGVTASGNQLSPVAVKHGDTIKAPEKITKEGYLFDGWYTDENCTNEFIFGEIPITEDTVLYAKWRGKVKVTFNSMGGTDIPSISVYEGELINSEIANPKKTGAEFVGWFTSPDCSADSRFFIETTKVYSDITLYAGWASDVYTVKFDSKGGKAVADTKIEHGKALGTLPQIEKLGYTLAGWYSDEEYISEVTTTTIITSNITLYAKWECIDYQISYELNGGVKIDGGNYPVDYYNIEEDCTISDLQYSSYPEYNYFLGWYEDENYTKAFANDLRENPRDIVLYAKWDIAESVYKDMSNNMVLNQGRIIVDWSHYEDGEYDFLAESERTDREVEINAMIKEIYFIGNPKAIYKNVNLAVTYSADTNNISKIYLHDFNMSDSSIRAIGQNEEQINKNIIFEVIGDSSVYAPNKTIAIDNFDDISINGVANSSLTIRGGDGINGVELGESGSDGATAIVANNITINYNGLLTVIGGNGGHGVSGRNGNNGGDAYGKNQPGGNGENGSIGGNGGNGGHSIIASKFEIVNAQSVLLQGGCGGAGGNGGNGGHGGHGSDDRGGAGGKAGNGGKGGNGGNGGSLIISQKTEVGSEVQVSKIKIAIGSSGAGGNGGTGGNGGKPGKNTWFAYKGGIPQNGGNGGDGGNGGIADISFKSYVTKDIVNEIDDKEYIGVSGIGGRRGLKSEPSGDSNGDDGSANDGSNGSDGAGRRELKETAYNGHKYILMVGRFSWYEAKAYAEECGGHLATVTSAEENSVLKQMVDESDLSGVWLGAENTSGSYVWVTGEKWDYSCWSPSEPSGGEEHYLGYYKTGGNNWNDYRIATDTVVGFIVEFE